MLIVSSNFPNQLYFIVPHPCYWAAIKRDNGYSPFKWIDDGSVYNETTQGFQWSPNDDPANLPHFHCACFGFDPDDYIRTRAQFCDFHYIGYICQHWGK